MTSIPLHHQPGHFPAEIVDVQRALHGRRISEAMAEKAARGVMPGCAPIGYVNAWVDGEKAIVSDERMAPLVLEAFELSASGLPLRKALAIVTQKGLRSRNGNRIGVSAFAGMLKNPFYCGLLRRGADTYPGGHHALISKTLFHRVQKGLTKRRR